MRKGAVLTVPGTGSAAAVLSVEAEYRRPTADQEKGDSTLYFLPNIPVVRLNRAECDGEPTSSG